MTILILGSPEDEHSAHMHQHLRSVGQDVEYFDTADFPQRLQVTLDPRRFEGSIRLPEGRILDFSTIQSIYWRNYRGVLPPSLEDEEQAYIASNDSRGLLESVLIRLPVRWVNGWSAFQLHRTKPVQLAIVSALGVLIPETLLANDAESILAFAERYPRSIFKPVQGGAHARPLTRAHLEPANLANLSYAPVTLQEEIVGTNIRVFVVGSRTLACEVRTAELDFRDDRQPLILPHELPFEVQDACRAIARSLDLLWTGIDFRLTPNGAYYFLEANPSPMFLGFERQCGLPLTESLAALLVDDGFV